jgi:uncharacterized protein YecT (DUF1311 family)
MSLVKPYLNLMTIPKLTQPLIAFPLLAITTLLITTTVQLGDRLLPTQISSAEAEATPEVDCNNANSTVTINYCAGLQYKEADRQLNQTYQQLKSTLTDREQEKLITAQQDWINYRDQNCKFAVRNNEGGTGYSAFLSGCLQRMTEQRTAALQK